MLEEDIGSSNPSFDCNTVLAMQAYTENASERRQSLTVHSNSQSPNACNNSDRASTIKAKGIRFSNGSIATLASMVEEPQIDISPVFPEHNPAQHVREIVGNPESPDTTTKQPTTYLPSTNAVVSLVSVVLCGCVNPCSILALKKSCDSAQALHGKDYAQARRDGIAAKHYALGGILLGTIILAGIFYSEIMYMLQRIARRLDDMSIN